jgi:hypothetical protein
MLTITPPMQTDIVILWTNGNAYQNIIAVFAKKKILAFQYLDNI